MVEKLKHDSAPSWKDYQEMRLPVVSGLLEQIERHAKGSPNEKELLGCLYLSLVPIGLSLVPFCLLHLGIRKTLYMRQKRKIEEEQRILRLSDGDILQVIDEDQVISKGKKKNSEI